MKLVILAGGYGTRIRDVSEDIPKPYQNRTISIIWHIMLFIINMVSKILHRLGIKVL